MEGALAHPDCLEHADCGVSWRDPLRSWSANEQGSRDMSEGDDNRALVENYARGGFARRLEFGVSPALIVIDFVNAYYLEDGPLFGGEGIRAAHRGALELLRAARRAGIPVFHTNLRYEKGGRNGGLLYRKIGALACFAEDAPDGRFGRFVEGLEPAPGESVITKQYASAFFATTLASTLTTMRIDTLLISGVSTSGCVRATAVDCCQYGFVPIVVRDAVGDRASAPHEASIFDLQAKYAEVVGLEEARKYLRRVAGGAAPMRTTQDGPG